MSSSRYRPTSTALACSGERMALHSSWDLLAEVIVVRADEAMAWGEVWTLRKRRGEKDRRTERLDNSLVSVQQCTLLPHVTFLPVKMACGRWQSCESWICLASNLTKELLNISQGLSDSSPLLDLYSMTVAGLRLRILRSVSLIHYYY